MDASDHPIAGIFSDSHRRLNGALNRLTLRIGCLVAFFVLELLVVSIRFDTEALNGRGSFIGAIGDFGPLLLHSIVAFAVVFVAFGYSKVRTALVPIAERLAGMPIRWSLFAAHL